MAIYEYTARIRYDEVDASGYLTTGAMINLFQNCSTFQSEDLGIGVEFLKERHRAWVLSSWNIHIEKMPFLGENVTVQTWSYGVKRALGFRNYRILAEDGSVISIADSKWVYVDLRDLSFISCTDREAELYGASPKLDMPIASRKIALPEVMTEAGTLEVPKYFIDTNMHMNNGKYLLVAEGCIPENFTVGNIMADFKKSAMLGDTIVIKHAYEPGQDDTPGKITVSLSDPNGEIFTNILFTEAK